MLVFYAKSFSLLSDPVDPSLWSPMARWNLWTSLGIEPRFAARPKVPHRERVLNQRSAKSRWRVFLRLSCRIWIWQNFSSFS